MEIIDKTIVSLYCQGKYLKKSTMEDIWNNIYMMCNILLSDEYYIKSVNKDNIPIYTKNYNKIYKDVGKLTNNIFKIKV